MSTKRTTNSTKKLAQLKEKMKTLQQEEEEIYQNLSQELSQCLFDFRAFDIDFDTLIGGIFEVVTEAQLDPKKARAWKKSGQSFRQLSRRRGQEKKQEEKSQRDHNPQHPSSPDLPQPEKVA